jgi:type I restriction enzyme S subunit
MTDLPPGWVWAQLEDLLAAEPRAITDGPFGSKLASRHYTPSGARVIRLQNIGDGFFKDERAYISHDYFQELRAHEVRAGDLVIASLGEALPRACIVPDIGPAIVKADCIRARIHPEVDPRWVLYMLMAPATRRYATSLIKGVGRPRLGLGAIRKIPLPVPPLAEQRRIVATLEGYLSRIDSADKQVRTALQRIPYLLIALLRDAIHGGIAGVSHADSAARELAGEGIAFKADPSLPTGWVRVRLGDMATTSSGGTPSRSNPAYYGGNIPWIKSGELRDGVVDSTSEFLTEAGLNSSSAKIVPRGTLLMAMYGATVGKLGISGLERAATNQAVCAIHPKIAEVRDYLWLTLEAFRPDLIRAAQGGAQPNISQSLIRAIEIPLPPRSVRADLAERTNEIKSSLLTLRYEAERAFRRSAHLRSSLLSKALGGRLGTGDDSDEPAEVLLRRISVERIVMHPKSRHRARSTEKALQRETLL